MLFAAAIGAQAAGTDEEDQAPAYPTTEFADGATSAAVTVGDVTAGISMVKRPEIDKEFDVPVLSVMVGQNKVLEVPGVASGMDFPAADASIADIDPDNSGPEVYFTSFSGGAHCCSNVVVGEQVGDKWVAVDIGDFDGDGNFLTDADGDGYAEIATVDNRFLYQFDCYACSVGAAGDHDREGRQGDRRDDRAALPGRPPRLAEADRGGRRAERAVDIAGLPRRLGGDEGARRRVRRCLEAAHRPLG